VNQTEIMTRVNALPDRFAGRLTSEGLADVRDAARAGEWAEALDVLIAGLIKGNAMVSLAERDELAALLEATGLQVETVARLRLL
jgi:hypothetical protein